MHRRKRLTSSIPRVAVALALLGTGCGAHAPAAAKATTAIDAGDFVPGEALVHLSAEAAPPQAVGELRCEPGAWAAERVLILRCGPVGAGREDTARLVDALRATPGVASADFNWIRQPGKAGHRSTP